MELTLDPKRPQEVLNCGRDADDFIRNGTFDSQSELRSVFIEIALREMEPP
jgi:hypothetical protein